MSGTLSMTAFQLGVHVCHALREPGSLRMLNLLMLREIPIVPDETEAWMQSYPQNQLVSRETAIAALRELELLLAKTRHEQLIKATAKRESTRAEIKARLQAELSKCEEDFLKEIRLVLRREPSEADRAALDAAHAEHQRILEVVQNYKKAGETEEEANRRRAVESGLKSIARYRSTTGMNPQEVPSVRRERLTAEERLHPTTPMSPAEELAVQDEATLVEKYRLTFSREDWRWLQSEA